jgi:hypothetical protein
VIFPNDAVFRGQMAALDPSDGRALAWDPGNNADVGTFDLTVIDRGLLAGMDEDRYNQILTGRSGFFDLGGFTPPAPAPAPAPVVATCSVEVINNVPVVSYSGFTNVPVVQFRRNNEWIGSGLPGAGTFEDTSAVAGVPYSYEVRSQTGGVMNDVACTPATITIGAGAPENPPATPVPVAAACSVSVNNNNVPVVSYSGFTNVSSVQFRRNNGWIGSAMPGAGTFDDTSAVAGVPYSYEVRTRTGGVVTDVACTPATFTF